MTRRLTITRPDDWHLHLRDGAMLRAVLPWSAGCFARAIVMPNLVPPVRTAREVAAYRARIMAALPAGMRFEPLMTIYLTEATAPADLIAAHRDGLALAAKLYPAGATTNSAAGVRDLAAIRPVLAAMERSGMPLLVHGEVTDPEVDVFDREAVFIERHLTRLLRDHPGLRIVLEHVTTAEGVAIVEAERRLGGTITPQHLAINRNAIFRGGLRPHFYCLPVAKRERHRLALRRAAISGESFFLGTDSAPHPVAAKEAACGCAGIFNAPSALAIYAQVFAEEGALDRLEAFASRNGPAFYGLAVNEDTLTLEEQAPDLPDTVATADGDRARVFRPDDGQPDHGLCWRVVPA